ncbi:MAG: hypothetical protein UW60_C0012G0002 [Candidatus Woesebacteria bacterium GW2011_GWA2_44_33]|uniref:Uncharacterized protein n=1 Tax=Candidatus Woesebacteria bacterium GW2011_GWA2_44_33 TaxID=1618564 RepID=A0A0G1J674_9BACT|nr:MAG: hypothetical protein UW60_C0012G0002 [Candidatus Woesebacteria bacterium GW2011_GWA2_44_33]
MPGVADGIAGGGIFNADRRNNLARKGILNKFPLVGVEKDKLANSFLVLLGTV